MSEEEEDVVRSRLAKTVLACIAGLADIEGMPDYANAEAYAKTLERLTGLAIRLIETHAAELARKGDC